MGNDLQKQTLTRKLFGVDGADIDAAYYTAGSDSVAGLRVLTDHPSDVWFDTDFKELSAQLDKAVAPRIAQIVSWSHNRKKLVVMVGAPNEPGRLYYFDVDIGAMQRLNPLEDPLKGVRFAEVRPVRYKARDGLEIPGYLTLPAGREPKNLPLIVMPHGGPYARDHLAYDYWAQFLANRGYAVLQPNFRGSTGLGKAFREKGKGQYGLGMQDDVVDGVRWVTQQGIADSKRVCIMGGSYGGYAAMWGAVRDASLYRCAISFAGIADVPRMHSYDRDLFSPKMTREFYGNLNRQDLRAISPAHVTTAATTRPPILIAHGKKDLRVPFAQSRDHAAALTKAGKPVEYLEMPLADHHLSRQADRVTFLTAVESFLTRHNPAD